MKWWALLVLAFLSAATVSCQDDKLVKKGSEEAAAAAVGTNDLLPGLPDDIAASGNCSAPASIFCGSVEHGKQKLLRCLTSVLVNMWDGNIPGSSVRKECVDEMMDFKLKLSTSIENDIYLKNACSKDASQLCQSEAGSPGAVVACLRKNMKKVNLSCKKELFRVMREASFDYRLDASLQDACEEDVKKSCADRVPGEGRVLACLHEKAFVDQESLSGQCKMEVVRQMRQDAGDIRLNFHLHSHCLSEIKSFCKGIEPGNDATLQCLMKHRHTQGFQERCLQVALEIERRQRLHLAQNKRLSSTCAEDLKTTCNMNETTLAQSVPEEQTKQLHCLIMHRDALEDTCMEEIKLLLVDQFQDIRLNPRLQSACNSEIDKYCSNSKKDDGSVINCLIENRREAFTDKCRSELFQQRTVRNENIQYHQPLLKACREDLAKFCPKVVPGNGRAMHCLSHYMNNEHMTTACHARLVALHQGEAEDYRLNFKLQKACTKDAQTLCSDQCDMHDTQKDCDGKVIACLQKNVAASNIKQKVSDECKTELAALTTIQAQDFRTVEGIADACDKDAENFCLKPQDGSIPVSPGQGRIFKCLFSHLDSLSDKCKKEEIRFKIMTAGKLSDQPAVLMMCQPELGSYCKDVHASEGAVMRCLVASHREHPTEFGSDCFSVLMDMAQTSLKDYRFNLGVRKKCGNIAKDFQCEAQVEGEDMSSEVQNGKVLECLVHNYKLLFQKGGEHMHCAMELAGLVRMGIDFYRRESPVTNVCDNDVTTLCQDELMEPGTCLIKTYAAGEKTLSTDCQELMGIGFMLEGTNSNTHQLTKKMENMSEQMANLVAMKSTPAEVRTENNNQGIIVAIVMVGCAVILTVGIGIALIQKYLKRGYAVLKSGDA